MEKKSYLVTRYIGLVLVVMVLAGCATVKSRKQDVISPSQRIAELEREVEAKDEQITELQAELESYQTSYRSESFTKASSASSNQIITVKGVTPTQLQKALKSAGFDPGSIDGRLGKQTVDAIKRFQRRHGLKADGVVGQKTWSLLKTKKG